MTTQDIETRLSAIGASAYVTADEVLFLRRTVFADGVVSSEELDAVFKLGERAPNGDHEWKQFFAEVVADYYLREEEPQGYLTPEEFETLKSRITRDGACASTLELGLLVKLMETAQKTPADMSAFTGDQFRQAITRRDGGAHVTKEDAALIKRYLFAVGGAGNVAVTREEAELLFDLNDAAENADNDPAWTSLFVTGVINHLMAHLGYQTLSREEAFRRDAWVKDHSVNVGGFFSRMVSGGLSGFGMLGKSKTAQAEQNEQRDAEVAVAAKVTPAEAEWIAARIGQDGAFDENEKALINRMRELEKDLPETLKSLVARAA